MSLRSTRHRHTEPPSEKSGVAGNQAAWSSPATTAIQIFRWFVWRLFGEECTLYAWFLASDIRAGTIKNPEFSLSADAMMPEHRPKMPDDPSWLYDGYVLVFFPEDEEWYLWKRYREPRVN